MDALSALLELSASEKETLGITHTPHEIAQQPQTWETTFSSLRRRVPEIQEHLHEAGISIASSKPTVFLVGAGTSDFIGHSLHHLLRRQWQCDVFPVASTSLLMELEEYVLPDREYLWVSFSRSGDSPEGVQIIERSLEQCPNVRHLVVSCNADGQMLRAIDGRAQSLGILLDDAVNDRGLAMTSSFTNLVLAGQFLAHAWSVDAYRADLSRADACRSDADSNCFRFSEEAGQRQLPARLFCRLHRVDRRCDGVCSEAFRTHSGKSADDVAINARSPPRTHGGSQSGDAVRKLDFL